MNTLQETYAAALAAYGIAQAAVNEVPMPETDDDEAWGITEMEIERVYVAVGYTAIMDRYNAATAALLEWSKSVGLSMVSNDEDRAAIIAAYDSKSIVVQHKLIDLALRLEA